jgi:corrinoid protein of di/trimethylamine methyltransferase
MYSEAQLHEVLDGLSSAVDEMDRVKSVEYAHRSIELGIDAFDAINDGLTAGMRIASAKFDSGEYFVPELLMAAKSLMAAVDVLKPYLKPSDTKVKARVVIGTIKGDVHSIGKDIVALMMEANGFDVLNLGANTQPIAYYEKAEEFGADIIGISALMSTTMMHMKDVVEILRERGVREKYIVMVGGAPVTQKFCDFVGADAFAPHAAAAVKTAQELMLARSASRAG